MGRYTQTVLEILQEAAPNANILDLSVLTDVSSQTLFLNAPLNVLSDKARANFITQFTLHYLRDEIGMETLPLWRFALAEKLYNNAEYINAIYDKLYLQAYTEVELNNHSSNGTRTSVGTASDVTANNLRSDTSHTDINTANGTRANTGSQATTSADNNVQTNDLTDLRQERGSNTVAKIGTDTATDTGTQATENNLQDQTLHNTTDTQNYGSTATQNYGSISEDLKNTKQKESNIKLYTTENEKSFDQRDTEKTFDGKAIDDSTSRIDQNAMGFNFDTPQGSLDELRDPGGVPGSGSGQSAVGKGIEYATGQDYNYFSAATENDSTAWNTGHNERSYDDYAEHTAEKGKEINKEKWNIDGTTNKDEREILTKFETGTVTITTPTGGSQVLDGDVNRKLGSDSNVKSGSDALVKTGTETLTKSGTQTRTDNLTHEVLYDTEETNTRNLDTTDRRTGSVRDNRQGFNQTFDDLHEATSNNQINNGSASTVNSGTINSDKNTSDNTLLSDTGNAETYKIDFLQWAMRPNIMNDVWKVFDDLFMWLYN